MEESVVRSAAGPPGARRSGLAWGRRGDDPMSTETEVPALLTAFGHPPQPVQAVIVEQAPGQRFARTLTGLGMFWGLGLASVFIPVAHFILVPTFVVAGLVMAVQRARGNRRPPLGPG